MDFDGPVCSVFAGYSAARVAGELVAVLEAAGVVVPVQLGGEPDPLAVLRWTGKTCPRPVLGATEDALRAAEIKAVRSATPTPFGRDVIVGAGERGMPIAVVSNNSGPAIRAYANRPWKVGALAGADAVVTSMRDVAVCVGLRFGG